MQTLQADPTVGGSHGIVTKLIASPRLMEAYGGHTCFINSSIQFQFIDSLCH